jgi:hypothetical protein
MEKPASVRRQAEASEKLVAEIAAGKTAQPAPAVNESPAPAPVAQPAAPVEPAPEAELAAAKKDADAWRQRYTVLKGKYDVEVPRLTEQLREANEKIADLNQKLSQAPKPVQISAEDREKLVDKFGEDMVNMVTKMVQNGLEQGIAPLQEKLATVETNVETTAKATQKTATQRYWDEVDNLLAAEGLKFDVVNDDPGFIAWLGEQDGLSGKTRLDSLERAQGSRNAKLTAQFFITYAKGLSKDGASSLEAQIQPDPSNAAPDPLNPNKGKIWMRAEIDQFYRDKRGGKYRGKQAEADRIEADILAATREKRIQ